MLTNANLTVYNRYIDPATRSEAYQRAHIKGVFWENRSAANKLAAGGQIAADKARVFIPLQRGLNYVKPKAWQALSKKAGKRTLQEGDIIVNGLVSDGITGAFSVSDLQAKYDDVLVITSIDRQDALDLGHWEVSAK